MSDTAPANPETTCGRMVIDLIDNGTSRPFPRVTFDPVGRFTPGIIEQFQMHFYHEIELAQSRVRAAARASPLVVEEASLDDDTATTPARRRAR